MEEIRVKLNRNKLIFALFISILFIILICKFFSLQILSNEMYLSRSEQNRIREVVVEPARGLIYDRNGNLIVDNRPAFSVSLIPYEVSRSKNVIPFFVKNNFVKLGIIEEKIKNTRMVFNPVKLIGQIDFVGLSMLEENKLDLPGVVYQTEPKRYYPSEVRVSHILGYIGEVNEKEIALLGEDHYHPGDIVGKMGIEKQYEKILHGNKGYKYIQVDALGREIESFISERQNIQPVQGKSIYLTIDLPLQKYCEELLEGGMGSIVVLNAKNGEILSLVSKPDYDPNFFSRNFTIEEWKKLSEDTSHVLINRATVGEYPPGSAFKLISAIAALNENIITPDWTRTCPGYYRLGRRIFSCFRNTAHEKLDLLQAIERSCNVYFYQLGLEIGIDVWAKYAKLFKFDEISEIDIPEEKAGNIPTREYMDRIYEKEGWTDGNLVNMAIGQGDILVTPMQMAAFAMAIGNEGIYYKPHLAKFIEDNETKDRTLIEVKSDTISEVSEYVYKIIKDGMYMVVNGEKGTGRAAKILGIDIGGKTGTAQNPHGEDHGWFIGFAPIDNPVIAFSILVENGGVGGAVAAPIARKFLTKYFRDNVIIAEKN